MCVGGKGVFTRLLYLFVLMPSEQLCCQSKETLGIEVGRTSAAVNGDGQEVPSAPDPLRFSHFVNDAYGRGQGPTGCHHGNNKDSEKQLQGEGVQSSFTWQPLLLIVPLRLGLTDINPIYFEALKVKRINILWVMGCAWWE